jgi:hypothetical protein
MTRLRWGRGVQDSSAVSSQGVVRSVTPGKQVVDCTYMQLNASPVQDSLITVTSEAL